MSSFPCRIILLLDLDCFYAQCERVRLGLDLNTPLCLLQWDSTLAVTYPARDLFQIKRGDSWDTIRQKSNGKCLALHLPLLTTTNTTTSTTTKVKPRITTNGDISTTCQTALTNGGDDDDDDNKEQQPSIQDAYEKVYGLSPEEQEKVRTNEIGLRRFAHEGKACLERYRTASMRIFSVIVESLTETLGRENFVLERASIDELFLDVTKNCWTKTTMNHRHDDDTLHVERVMAKTVHVGETFRNDEDDPAIQEALARGCLVAHTIRKAVFDTLGFTLSAGISTSKLVAKLGASYGKPNGQAVIVPSAIPHVMDETPIRKVRNLGGKVGRQVQVLLPTAATSTMGDVARQLSLPILCRELGDETGKKVFDACRGVDNEPVKETVGALVKSITAFKSFRKANLLSDEVTEWITLLATDVVGRVQLDASRNNRYPRSCTVQYSCSNETLKDRSGRATRSVRVAFPRENEDIGRKLVQRAKDAIYRKEGEVFVHRIGLCAVDFQRRMEKGGISNFFSKDNSKAASRLELGTSPSLDQADRIDSSFQCSQDEEMAHKIHADLQKDSSEAPPVPSGITTDDDFALAQKLQASYDRENYILSTAEKRLVDKPVKRESSKRQRIDSFFRKL